MIFNMVERVKLMCNNSKLNLGRTLASVGYLGVYSLSDCESYGMMNGCDEDCPVLNSGECELYSSVEGYLEDK